MSDGGANPYAAVATVLAAARPVVVDRLAPCSPEDLDGIEHVRAEHHTPPTLTRRWTGWKRTAALSKR